MSFNHRGPLLHSRPGTVFHGVPLPALDVGPNGNTTVSVIGNGSYTGPVASAAPSGSTTSAEAGGWKLSNTSSSTTLATIIGASAGGLTITCGATDEDWHQIQRLAHAYRYGSTYSAGFFARIALADVDTTDLFFGFAPEDTTLIAASAEGVSDGIYFKKAATATDYTAGVQKNTTETTGVAGLTLVDAGYAVIGIVITGGLIRYYGVLDANNLVKGDPSLLGAGTSIAITNVPDDIDLFPSFGVGAEGTGADAVTLDWAVWWNKHA